MNIFIQINTIIFSFVYGMFFSLILNITYKYLIGCKKFFSLLINLLFIFDNVLLYFILLCKINGGILHLYSVFCLILGYIVFNKVYIYFKK